MTRRCSNKSCFVSDGESCALGHPEPSDCPCWEKVPLEEEATQGSTESSWRVPWSGSTLGSADLANLTPRARPIFVGVLGAHDAGKTTLLTGNYLRLVRGESLAGAHFAGSRTLGAWESLAAWTRFHDAPRSPSFPPHTPRGTARVPGILHLALRNSSNEIRDVLLADAPGEWFTRWSTKEDAPDSEGARWIARNAHAFLVLADCERLCGPERGTMRSGMRKLLERLGNHVGARPTVLVWSKADASPSGEIKKVIRDTLMSRIPHAREAESTTQNIDTLSSALAEALMPAWAGPRAQPIVEPVLRVEPFGAFRGNPHASA